MGNVPSDAVCRTGVENSKEGALTPVTSEEELQQYAKQEEKLRSINWLKGSSRGSSSRGSNRSIRGSYRDEKLTRSSRKHGSGSRRNKGPKFLRNIAKAFKPKGEKKEERKIVKKQKPAIPVPKVKGPRLQGCTTDQEHHEKARECVELVRAMKGEEGLQALGFDYRVVEVDLNEALGAVDMPEEKEGQEEGIPKPGSQVPGMEIEDEPTETRLFHTESDTMVTLQNRKQFIADGDMYDVVARLCQEYAQEVMIQEGNLVWVTVCDKGNNPEPIRALVSAALKDDDSHLDKTPTLLIATGKGKVRAGIFSRQHIIVSGIECSTAVPIVRQAKDRKMNVVMLDPNVHGDRMGMATFEKSMSSLFQRWEENEQQQETCSADQPPLAKRDLFVLSHSQSGAQFARYLLEKSAHYVPHIRAVAFTDSTHNIQWAKQNEDLHELLESDKSVYFKYAKDQTEEPLTQLETLGEDVDTDHHWEHRFGRIKTKCAGTTEHSLTNWFARTHIWDHFDSFLHGGKDQANTKD